MWRVETLFKVDLRSGDRCTVRVMEPLVGADFVPGPDVHPHHVDKRSTHTALLLVKRGYGQFFIGRIQTVEYQTVTSKTGSIQNVLLLVRI